MSTWGKASPSSFSTAIRPGPINGATLFLPSAPFAAALHRTSWAWGWSGKSPTKAYRFVDHARYMDAWFEALQLTANVTLVLHDWGAAIGFYRARRHPEQIKAIAYYEAVAHPRRWEDFSGGRDRQFRLLRSPEGERLVLDENMFVEVVLPRGILRKLTDDEMEAYRAPYRDRERRLPTLIWSREVPIEGGAADVVASVDGNC